jgi:putative FmdB family regulatory protein
MPTYTFICSECESHRDVVMSMREYDQHPPKLYHCGKRMQRHFSHAPGIAVGNDSLYQGMRAPDGTDISTRAKHRAYMKANNLTTVDDFKSTWAKQAKERQETLAGVDRDRARDIANAIDKLGG